MIDAPILKPRDDGKWELAAPFGEVPEGFVTDGGSIPRFFWRLVGAPIEARTIGAFIRHDWNYSTGIMARAEADKILYDDLRASGVGYFRAKSIYFAVRSFGWLHY